MSSTYGESLKLSIFGQSHGPAVGMVLDGIPAGLPVDLEALQTFLNRRAPGQNDWSTPRKEEDRPEFLSGILDGFTCGAPIATAIYNRNTRSGDYANLKDCPRPGHADYTAQVKYGGFQDAAGGGHFSGRLTAPLCVAGGLCKQWLALNGIVIGGRILSIAGCDETDDPLDPCVPEIPAIGPDFPVVNPRVGEAMRQAIAQTRKDGDSVGGVIECVITGLPAGLGEPMFGGVESKLAQILYGIPAVKGVSFGDGFAVAGVIFRIAVKPTPSIARPQSSVSLSRNCPQELTVKGRHDPCIVPRAVPVAEAAAAIAIFDMLLGNTQTNRRK